MILFVDMEHPRAVRRGAPCPEVGDNPQAEREAYIDDVRRRLEVCSGTRCVARRYWEITERWLDSQGAVALILGGNVTDWGAYDQARLEPLMRIVRAASLPILGLCGGLQFIALAHGFDVGPIRTLAPGEDDAGASFGAGYLKEWGYTEVDVLADQDPIFDGLTESGEPPIFLEAHYCEVKAVPEGFELLASTPMTPVQAFRRTGTLVYGTQFHPEAYIAQPDDADNCLIRQVYPDGYAGRQPAGRRFLMNFFRTAGIQNEPVR